MHNVTFQETDLEAASLSGHLDTVVLLHEKYGIPCTPHALAGMSIPSAFISSMQNNNNY